MTLGMCCDSCDILDIRHPDCGPHSCANANHCDGHSIPAHVTLYAVVCDTAGAHEAECVYSIWSSEAQAHAEVLRMLTKGVQRGCYEGDLYVVAVETNTPSDEWIS